MGKINEIIGNKECYGGLTLQERMKECRTPAISIVIINDYKIEDVYAYGVKNNLGFGHNGSNNGYQSDMGFRSSDGTGIVVMQNADIGYMIVKEVVNAFKNSYGW